MQGVDRLDQLRARFSLADGHSFQKWHIKLAMAFIDMARVNAYQTRKLACPNIYKTRDPHQDFVKELARELISGAWKQAINEFQIVYESTSSAPSTPTASAPNTPTSRRETSDEADSPFAACEVVPSKTFFSSEGKKKEYNRSCVICRLEGRTGSIVTQYCKAHKVSLCLDVYAFKHASSAACPYEWNCWDKFHKFYQPKFNVYDGNGNLRRKGRVFKEVWTGDPRKNKVNDDSV